MPQPNSQQLRESLEALQVNYGWLAVVEAIELEIGRHQRTLQNTDPTKSGEIGQAQGWIKALELVRGLPKQIESWIKLNEGQPRQ